ncbi:MAG: DUF2490 domain-containing protein [Bacteroidales bacterium]|nr:DUF2490 domain-containing protein [Bacteroidales bacterium]
MNRLCVSAVLLLLVSFGLPAQEKDFGFWTSIAAEKQIKKWELGTEVELRTKNNGRQVDRWSFEAEASYTLIEQLKAGAGYKFIYFHDLKYLDFQPRNRFFLFLQGKLEYGDFTFWLREFIQLTTKDESDRIKESGKTDTYRMNPETTWRNRLKVAYDIPKFPLNPCLSFESFYQLNNPEGSMFEQLRLKLSFDYRLNEQHEFEFFGLIDKEMNEDNNVQAIVAGLGYKFVFQ